MTDLGLFTLLHAQIILYQKLGVRQLLFFIFLTFLAKIIIFLFPSKKLGS